MPKPRHFLLGIALFLLLPAATRGAGPESRRIWSEIDMVENAVPDADLATPDPIRYRSFAIELDGLREQLRAASSASGAKSWTEMVLPMPDGRLARFRAFESPILGDEMRRALPDVRTYSVRGVDEPEAYGRVDFTRLGLRAYVLTPGGTVMIDPLVRGRTDRVMSYWTRDEANEDLPFECEIKDRASAAAHAAGPPLAVHRAGDTLRTYRFVILATAEYNKTFGGDTLVGLAELATCVNRINVPYERDLAIHFDAVLLKTWPDSTTDPFNPPNDLVDRAQVVADSLIGNGSYDLGQIVHRNSGLPNSYGGLGYLPAICEATYKVGALITGGALTAPTFYRIQMHEMGHNFSSHHAWDAPCNRSNGYAYEPGSGSTIMGRAGRCAPYNIQPECDHYFHTWSQQEITWHMGVLPDCGTRLATGNSIPTVDAGPNYTVPRSTPFVLTGAGSDPDAGDVLTYGWEQFDQTTNPFDITFGPLFRSYIPVNTPVRYFPLLPAVLSNVYDPWDKMATVNRVMQFRLTVRDNARPAGGHARDSMTITVSGAPFFVNFPNGGETIARTNPFTVTWTVGGGNIAPTVNILLSENGGASWMPLALATPNDGSETFTLGGVSSFPSCRIKVEAVGNVFYDVSNANFAIQGTTVDADLPGLPSAFALWPPEPNPSKTTASVRFDLPHAAGVDLAVYTVQGQRVRTLSARTWPVGRHAVSWNGGDESGARVSAGVYFIRLNVGELSATQRVVMLE